MVVLSRSASFASSICVYWPPIAWASTQYSRGVEPDLGEGGGHPGGQHMRGMGEQEADVNHLPPLDGAAAAFTRP